MGDFEQHKWEWERKYVSNDRVMNRGEYDEMRRIFELYGLKWEDTPAIYKASYEYWWTKDLTLDMRLCSLRYEKENGTLAERIEKRLKAKEQNDG